jgi:hypothetical protein
MCQIYVCSCQLHEVAKEAISCHDIDGVSLAITHVTCDLQAPGYNLGTCIVTEVSNIFPLYVLVAKDRTVPSDIQIDHDQGHTPWDIVLLLLIWRCSPYRALASSL